MDKIAIILVNYNGFQDTVECIESLNMSSYKNIEIIVVDNCSEESCDSVTELPNTILIKYQENVGFGIANNIGAEYAVAHGAKYIMCLNNDTIVDSEALNELVKNTNDNTITTCAINYYGSEDLWYGGGKVSRWTGNFRHKKYTENREVSFVSGCCFMMTTATYERIGLFEPEYFMYYEDGDFSLKALKSGIKLLYLYEAKTWHKVGRSISRSIGMKDYYLTRNRLYILDKYKDYFKWTAKPYFYITRLIYILSSTLNGKNPDPFLNGIAAYRKNEMGRFSAKQ